MEKSTQRKNKDVAVTKTAEQPPVATDATNASPEEKRRPVKTIRVNDCSVSIWTRVHLGRGGQSRTFYSCSFERSFRDASGAYKYTRSFDPESLGALVSLAQQASEAIAGMMQLDAAA